MYDRLICSHFKHTWKQSCLDIQKKAPYRNYPMNLSILSDFRDEDLEKMMDLGVKYSGEGSYAEPESTLAPSWPNEYVVGRDMCEGTEKYSAPHSFSTSWASALVLAAEAALRKERYYEPLSLPYVLKCLPESQEIEPNDVAPQDIAAFVTEKGLMSEAVAGLLNENELCSANTPKFYFEVTKNDSPNKSGLMNFIAKGDPVIVLMALDLVRMKTVNDVTGDDIYTGATDEPSLYGVMKGFDETKWTVTFNVVPCENIEMNLPVTDSETNANYAGIAGYAMSIQFITAPLETRFQDTQDDINRIPADISVLRFTHSELSNVQELYFTYPYLRSLTLEDYTFPNVFNFTLDCPIIENIHIGDGCLSQSLARRLMELNGYFRLNTPSLMLIQVGIQSLLNFWVISVTQINSNLTLQLGDESLSNITSIE